MQPKNLSAPSAGSADELREDVARANAKTDDANLSRDWDAVLSLQRHCDPVHVERQST
jgi:hypothetical protein